MSGEGKHSEVKPRQCRELSEVERSSWRWREAIRGGGE